LAKHCKTMNNEKQKRQKKNKKYNVVNRKSWKKVFGLLSRVSVTWSHTDLPKTD
jgi:hypothetical protein